MTLTQQPDQDPFVAAIQAIERGDNTKGQALLRKVLHYDPQNELAWLWLAVAVPTQQQRIECLEQVLAINPENRAALETLQEISQTALIPDETVFQRHDVEETEDLVDLEEIPAVDDTARESVGYASKHPKIDIRPPRFPWPHIMLPSFSMPVINWDAIRARLPRLKLSRRIQERRDEKLDFEAPLLDEPYLTKQENGLASSPDAPNREITPSKRALKHQLSGFQDHSNTMWGQVGIGAGVVVLFLAVAILIAGLKAQVPDNMEIQRLQESGVAAKARIDGLMVFEEAQGNRYVVTYEYQVRQASGDLQTFRRQDNIRHETFARLAHHLPVNLRYLPVDPGVARFETELVPASETTARLLGGIGLALILMGAGILLTGVVIWFRTPLVVRQGRSAGGMIIDLWSETDALGQPVYHIAYQYKALGRRKKQPQVYTRGMAVSASLFRTLRLGASVQVRYLPRDPFTSTVVGLRPR